jgi:peptidoglycan/xylan/chitin deacetylase (PgdA/CDA1 family)
LKPGNVGPATAQPTRETLTVDLPNDAATLDPHLQWDTDSYAIYRNIFDNLVTRDVEGRIVPQVAEAWRYVDDTTIELTICPGIRFHDGSALTAEDVAFVVRRITGPAFRSPQLSQFDQIVAADAPNPTTVVLRTRSPHPALLAQLVKRDAAPRPDDPRPRRRVLAPGPRGTPRGGRMTAPVLTVDEVAVHFTPRGGLFALVCPPVRASTAFRHLPVRPPRAQRASGRSARRLPPRLKEFPMSYDETKPWTFPEEVWRARIDRARAGRTLTPRTWPGGARLAVALSFDADHETIELRFGGKSPGKISQGQYGARRGTPRILEVLERYGVPATFFMPAVAAMITPEEPKAVVAAGHELGIHSWIHEFNSQLDHATERDLAFRAADTLERLSGKRPVGMRTASWDFSPYTLKIVRELGLLYDSSLMADDEPYELLDDGAPTGIVELPVEWIRDDAVYFNMDRMAALRPYGGPEMVFDIFRRELEVAHQEGGLYLLTMHPHHIGHRSRIFILEEIIRLARSLPGVWFATHEEIAEACKAELGT